MGTAVFVCVRVGAIATLLYAVAVVATTVRSRLVAGIILVELALAVTALIRVLTVDHTRMGARVPPTNDDGELNLGTVPKAWRAWDGTAGSAPETPEFAEQTADPASRPATTSAGMAKAMQMARAQLVDLQSGKDVARRVRQVDHSRTAGVSDAVESRCWR